MSNSDTVKKTVHASLITNYARLYPAGGSALSFCLFTAKKNTLDFAPTEQISLTETFQRNCSNETRIHCHIPALVKILWINYFEIISE